MLYGKILSIFLLSLSIISCNTNNMGFFQPMTIDLEVPDGPIEYRAGWYAGCKSGLANGGFANAVVYKKNGGPDFGDPRFHKDPAFHKGWGQGWFACVIHVGTFTNRPAFQHSLLQ